MSLTVAQVYLVRFGAKLSLPKGVQDNIAKLRITPVAYKPFRPPPKHGSFRPRNDSSNKHPSSENWREKSISNYVSRLKDKGDVDYFEIFAILNKMTAANLNQLTDEATEILRKRDQEFRLRVTTLLFDKAVTEHMFASVLADFAVKLNEIFPDVAEDFSIHAKMFTKLYDINTTLTYPLLSESRFSEKVVDWMKQKEKRRGYAKFLTQLFVRNLITEDIMVTSIQDVIIELEITASQVKGEHAEENTTQYVDFLYESSKCLPKTSEKIYKIIKEMILRFLDRPRSEVPNLCMRSRFRLEDTLKCVQ